MIDFPTFSFVLLPLSLIAVIIVLLNQRIEQNFGTFSARISKSFAANSVFRFFRISFVLNLVYVSSFYVSSGNTLSTIEDDFLLNVLNSPLRYPIHFVALILIWSFSLYRIKRNVIDASIRLKQESRLRSYFGYYFIYLMLNVLLFLFIYFLTFWIFVKFDTAMLSNSIFPNHELEQEWGSEVNVNFLYRRGVYWSILLTMFFAVFVVTAMLKRLSLERKNRTFYFWFATLIASAGLYTGLYAVLNYLSNYFANDIFQWKDHDKLIGHFSIRITALFLFYNVVKFTFKNVFGSSWKFLISYALFPIFPSRNEVFGMDRMDHDITSYYNRYYLAQLGFYILNVIVAEIVVVNFDSFNWLALIFAFLPVIVDDYSIMHDYFEKYGELMPQHRRKKNAFNLILFALSVIGLASLGNYFLLVCYVAFCVLLALLHPKSTLNPKFD